MNKTTLEGLEEALERLEQIDGKYFSWAHLLFEVREALAEQPTVLEDPHPPHRLCECTACLEYWTPLPDCDAFAASVKPIAEQEPVAVVEITYGREPECYVTGNIDDFPDGVYKLYAALVDAKAIRAEALEEAAKVCESKELRGIIAGMCAAAIRGLK